MRDQEYRRAGADAHGRSASRTPQPQKRRRGAVCRNQIPRESKTRGSALHLGCKDRKCHALRTQLQQPHSFLRSVLQRQNRTKIILSLPPRERRQPQAGVTLYGHHLLPLPRVRCRARFTLPCVRRCRTRKNNLVLKKEDSLVRLEI